MQPQQNLLCLVLDFIMFVAFLTGNGLSLDCCMYFLTYSHGMLTISEEDFGRVLLKYTDVADTEEYINTLRKRIPQEKVCICAPITKSWNKFGLAIISHPMCAFTTTYRFLLNTCNCISSLFFKFLWPGECEGIFRSLSQAASCLPHTVEASH